MMFLSLPSHMSINKQKNLKNKEYSISSLLRGFFFPHEHVLDIIRFFCAPIEMIVYLLCSPIIWYCAHFH